MKDTSRQKTDRDAILDATDRLLARNGYKKMTIDDLANEVGIGKGSVYLFFESKEEIALSHIDRIITRLGTKLRNIAARPGPADKRLRQMLIERVLYRFDSVQHYSQSLNELLGQLRPRLLDRRRRYFEAEAKVFADVVRQGTADGSFETKDPDLTAGSLLEATNALLPYSLSALELCERKDVEKKAKLVVDLLLNGLRARN
ncbi:MAG: TetR/AcrR family transcriptional regulator [Pyrinomonadaceae bacterium]